MATNPAKTGALRAVGLTMTVLLLGVSVLAPAASAVGGVPVDPARVVRTVLDAVDGITGPVAPCPPICPPPPPVYCGPYYVNGQPYWIC